MQTGDQQISPTAPCRVAAQNSACAYPSNGQYPNAPYNNPSYGPYPSPYSNPPSGPNGSPALPQVPPLLQAPGSAQVLQTRSGAAATGLATLSSQNGSLLSSLNGSDRDTYEHSTHPPGCMGPHRTPGTSGLRSP